MSPPPFGGVWNLVICGPMSRPVRGLMRGWVGAFVACGAAAASPGAGQGMRFVESAAGLGCVHTFSPAGGYPGTHDQMVGGLAVADFDGDGWPDIYALGGGNEPDRLLLNRFGAGLGRFDEADGSAAGWNVPGPHRGAAVVAGDVNRDGLVDLYIVSYGGVGSPTHGAGHMLLLNRGGWFEEVGARAGVSRTTSGVDGTGAVLGDVDNDGDLDLFVCGWFSNTRANRLFVNTGTGADGVPVFVDATDAMGVSLDGVRGYTPRMVDLNGDGLAELLLTADFRTSRLLVNLGPGADGLPRFADATGAAGITADSNGMGAAIGDVDNDGDLDWFMTDIYSAFTGNTNTLYLNGGMGTDGAGGGLSPVFTDVAAVAGVTNVGWGWGAAFGDFDCDGDLDLAATGGWFQYPPTAARLYENLGIPGDDPGGVPRFADRAAASGFVFQGMGRTVATLDFDRDGDLDIAMSVRGAMRLFLNDTANGNGRLLISVDTSGHPCVAPEGRHTRVEVESIDAGGSPRRQVRVLDGGPTYVGHGELVAHFGLGAASRAESVRVVLADGSARDFGPLDAGLHTLTVTHPADANGDGAIDAGDLPGFVAAFLAGEPAADLNGDGLFDLSDVVRFAHAAGGNACW